ncbi:MAG: hypothetical protein IK137_00710 [Bacilli bacterium]|nr:hypothetical protein [Bacilli bacterium]
MKTNKDLLEFEEQKKLYEKFSVDTLESLETLYYYILDEKPPLAFNIIYQKKYDENIDNYNGRNEITENIAIENFNISEINSMLDDLSDQELAVISRPILKAISVINMSDYESSLIPKLIEFQSVQQESISHRFTPIAYGMLPKDVKNFFSKFSYIGLDNFDKILDNTHHERLKDIKRVKNEALLIKRKKYNNVTTCTTTTISTYKLTDLKITLSSLTEIELSFFADLVKDAFESTNDNDMNELLKSIETEIQERPNKVNKKTV